MTRMTDSELNRMDEAARLDGNYMARQLISELRSLRLTDEEVKSLMWARDEIRVIARRSMNPDWMNRAGRALSVLDKLTKRSGA